jgi:hypothetical protein
MAFDKTKYSQEHFKKWYSKEENAKKRKEQAKIQRAKSLKRNRDFVRQYKEVHPCEKCGEKHPVCLDFHHKDPETKLSTVSELTVGMVSLEKLKAEIDKCQVLCRNCHAKVHEEID